MLNKDEINARLLKSIQGKTPKLKCVVCGLERSTSMDYLKTKEKKFGSIENYIRNFISREAVAKLKENKTISEIKFELNPDSNFIPNEEVVIEAKKYYGL